MEIKNKESISKKIGLSILIAIIILFFVMSFVSASTQVLGSARQNTCIELIQTCVDCTYVNITSIVFPDKTVSYLNKGMSQNSATYNYTFCSTSQIGNYIYNTIGDPSGIGVNQPVSFEISGSGLTGTLGFYFLILILSIGLIVLGYYVEDAWIVVLGSFSLVLVGLYTLFYGLDGIKDPTYTWGIGLIVLMLGVYFGIKATLEKIDN